MTTRPAGRHRKGISSYRPRHLLLLDDPGGPGTFLNSELLSSDFLNRDFLNRDFLNSGIVPNGRPLFSPGGGRRAPRAAQARDRRAFGMALSAAVAGVTAAAIFGSFAPLHSTWMAGGAPGAAGGPAPQTPVPWSAAPLGSPSGPPVPQGPPRRPGERPASPHRPRHAAAPRTSRAADTSRAAGNRTGAGTGTGAATGTGASAGTRTSPSAGTRTSPSAGTRTSPSAGKGTGRAGAAPVVAVRYLVDRQWPGGFQGQVHVLNNGAQPIAGWQVVVALPGDTVTSVWNASGFVSHHILLLSPASAAQVVPPGGTLDVFFVASGAETVPAACAFDGTPCG